MSRCVYFSRCDADPWGNGAQRRTVALLRTLDRYDVRWVHVTSAGTERSRLDACVKRLLGSAYAKTWGLLMSLAATNGEYLFWHWDRRDYVQRMRTAARRAAARVRDGDYHIALVDDPVYFRPLVQRLKRAGIPVVAHCHNLETLSRWQVKPRWQRLLLDRELNDLAACDLIVTVSSAENLLLNSLGMTSVLFRYFPPEPSRKALLRIREQRADARGEGILMLGSTGTGASAQGMEKAIRAWTRYRLAETLGPLRVGGFGTESLRHAVEGADGQVVLLGPLSREKCDEELKRAGACLCCQVGASGTLSRIMEMLIAGVPVLADHHAARCYHNWPGVVEFSSFSRLPEAVQRLPKRAADVPVPDEPDPRPVLEAMDALLNRTVPPASCPGEKGGSVA